MEEQVIARLDLLAAKLGVAAEHLWEVLIRQAPISAFTDMATAIGWLALLAWLWKVAMRHKPKDPRDLYEDLYGSTVLWNTGIVVLTILSFCVLACLESSIGDVTTALLNPEYWALNEIKEALK